MADVKFKPLGNRIVVQPLEEEAQVSAGGIYIPDTAKEKPQEGKVVAVGRENLLKMAHEFLWKSQLETKLFILSMVVLNTR
ncbi:MAG: hypothetical protein CM1200mP38_7990 [Dehalococcoidia bacterium]|nr:MAG: hypothetical protein CM1200mP38_7990 [Dehalococcoidia bacterium]